MIFTIFLFPALVFSHVIQDDVSTLEKVRFSLKTVCAKMVTHESPLIDVISGTEIECMGKKVTASSFCEKEMAADPYYLRAYVDAASKEAVSYTHLTLPTNREV